MKTILGFAADCRNCKTLNLSIVGFGENERVYQFLQKAKAQLSSLFTTLPVAFYSLETLKRAEGNPQLLEKKVALTSLRITKKDFAREYVGFVNQFEDAELYDYLFASEYNDAAFWNKDWVPCPYYSINNLSAIVHEKFGQDDEDKEVTFADVSVEMTHKILPSGKSFAKVDCKIGAYLCENSLEDYTRKLQDIVKTLDMHCPDTLHSAYISLNYPDMAITRQRVYRYYDPEVLERYILGAEWYVYLSKRIYLEPKMLENVERFAAAEKTANGIVLMANTNIATFGADYRKKVSGALESILIPAVGEYCWSGLHHQRWRVNELPQRIDVFSDAHNIEDPIVVMSHNCDIAHWCEMKKISLKDRMASFALK